MSKPTSCNCLDDVAKQVKEINGCRLVEIETCNKRPFNNFRTIEHGSNVPEFLPMPCKFCPFCGVKYSTDDKKC